MRTIKIAIFPKGLYDGELIQESLEGFFKQQDVAIEFQVFSNGSNFSNLSNFNIAFISQDFGNSPDFGIDRARQIKESFPQLFRITYTDNSELSEVHRNLASEINGINLFMKNFSIHSVRELTKLASDSLGVSEEESFDESGKEFGKLD